MDAHCSQYSCLEPDRCPPGTNYSEFWIGEQLAGYACTPPQHQPSNFFQCNFDDDGKLQITAVGQVLQKCILLEHVIHTT